MIDDDKARADHALDRLVEIARSVGVDLDSDRLALIDAVYAAQDFANAIAGANHYTRELVDQSKQPRYRDAPTPDPAERGSFAANAAREYRRVARMRH